MIGTSAKVGSGPLSSTAARLTDAFAPPIGPTDPAVFLARLMTLRGSVELAQRLEASRARGEARGGDRLPEERATLRALIAERALGLRAYVNASFVDAAPRPRKLPTPAQVMAAVAEVGALGDGPTRARVTAAETVWAPCGELITRTLDRVRFELRALREEISPLLAALGPGAARLEQLDAALFAATAEGRAALEDRVLAAIGRSFVRRFAVEVAALPPPVAPSHFAPWFVRGGVLRDALDAGRDTVLGVLEHDLRRLAALVPGP